jgi:hypothetical protein
LACLHFPLANIGAFFELLARFCESASSSSRAMRSALAWKFSLNGTLDRYLVIAEVLIVENLAHDALALVRWWL